jgi:hypothetical protein
VGARAAAGREPQHLLRVESAEPVPALVIEVTLAGTVAVSAPHGPVSFPPVDVERLRWALELARAVALWEAGGW